MEIEGLVEQFLNDQVPPQILSMPLPVEVAAAVVDRLKEEADRHWYINPHRSLTFADRIVTIGTQQDNPSQIALGLMARGDALSFLGRTTEAWETLDQAGNMFQTIEDEIGWARTRIGRLHLSPMLNRVADALADAERGERSR